MSTKTFHQYYAGCTQALYEEYGQIDALLLQHDIQSLGLDLGKSFRAQDGMMYRYAVVVQSEQPLEGRLHELFPGITTSWQHQEVVYDLDEIRNQQVRTHMKKGKLYVKPGDDSTVSIRI